MQLDRIFLPAILTLFLATNSFALDSRKTDYKVGDRLPQHAAASKSAYKQITWDDLMPKDWDPMAAFKKLDLSKLKDSDPRAQEALLNMRQSWSNAPIEPSMDGARVRIPGFIVPLESAHNKISEFLLVPFFGGCIHVPPPPPNQIIHVFPPQPLKGMQSMDSVWISGVLETVPSSTGMGDASYRMKADKVELYQQ
ncbi:MAG: DUF3299 domain-containing protein [Nitrosomonadales bacterium]|nr:DUF3299 domain-containing protein [Nitrosomonadales bacterium]